MKKIVGILIAVIAIFAFIVRFWSSPSNEISTIAPTDDNSALIPARIEDVSAENSASAAASAAQIAKNSAENSENAENSVIINENGDSEAVKSDAEAKAEKFDAAVDAWMDAETTKTPTMKDVDAFHALFNAVDKEQKEDCLRRALNLIPDSNIMLLVGILMDSEEDKDLVELIYNDVLNRPEEVKMPILETIFKDRHHPCWADTAWIFDVTGKLQNSK